MHAIRDRKRERLTLNFHFALTLIFLHLDLENRSGYLTISKTNPFFVLLFALALYFLGKEVIWVEFSSFCNGSC